jgi:hypothetical protein
MVSKSIHHSVHIAVEALYDTHAVLAQSEAGPARAAERHTSAVPQDMRSSVVAAAQYTEPEVDLEAVLAMLLTQWRLAFLAAAEPDSNAAVEEIDTAVPEFQEFRTNWPRAAAYPLCYRRNNQMQHRQQSTHWRRQPELMVAAC